MPHAWRTARGRPGDAESHVEPAVAESVLDGRGWGRKTGLEPTTPALALTVSLEQGGAGWALRREMDVARQLLAEAGFDVQAVDDVPSDPRSGLFVARRP
jgi:hypothetical protein